MEKTMLPYMSLARFQLDAALSNTIEMHASLNDWQQWNVFKIYAIESLKSH